MLQRQDKLFFLLHFTSSFSLSVCPIFFLFPFILSFSSSTAFFSLTLFFPFCAFFLFFSFAHILPSFPFPSFRPFLPSFLFPFLIYFLYFAHKHTPFLFPQFSSRTYFLLTNIFFSASLTVLLHLFSVLCQTAHSADEYINSALQLANKCTMYSSCPKIIGI